MKIKYPCKVKFIGHNDPKDSCIILFTHGNVGTIISKENNCVFSVGQSGAWSWPKYPQYWKVLNNKIKQTETPLNRANWQ